MHNPFAKKPFSTLGFLLCWLVLSASAQEASDNSVAYGANETSGKYTRANDISLYYEVYGEGEPLLLIHGNGQSIAAMRHQIEFFVKDYRVIVADSRGHGKSGLGEGRLTYEKMAADLRALVDQLGLEKINILGWSDGGILGLLLAIEHPDLVNKMAIMGANLQPDESAVYPWAIEFVAGLNRIVEDKIAAGDTTDNWELARQHLGLVATQPDIAFADLAGITAPVLVIAGDKDVIKGEHTVAMFEHIPNAHLAILPGQTHMAPETDPGMFNDMVSKFFSTPFTRPDTRDLMVE